VSFDPVRAKAEGRDTGLPKPLADLFPDSFDRSELGETPGGWGVSPIGELLELVYGKALVEGSRQTGGVPVFGSNGQIGWHDEALVRGPGIVVGRKGNPGVVTWVPADFFPIDTTFYVVPKEKGRSVHFLFYALLLQNLDLLGADSAVPGLNRNLAYMSKQVVPPTPILDAFDVIARPIFQRMHQHDEQSRTLAGLRDTLLHKLISRELRMKDPARILGGRI
jgi:type I restriction enzyme S subunit